MKAFAIVALSLVSSIALADGAGTGTEEVIAAGGLTTVVGGCADARVVGSGENQDIVYTEPCKTAPTSPRRYIQSNYFRTFSSEVEAGQNCNVKDEVIATLGWNGQIRGWVCRELNNQNTGN